MSAITAVTVQNSLGVSGFYELPPAAVAEQIESVVTDIGVGAAKTGMLASAAIIVGRGRDSGPARRRARSSSIRWPPRSTATRCCARTRSTRCATLILPLATLVTPNLGEVRLLTGITVTDDAVRPRRRARAARARARGRRW